MRRNHVSKMRMYATGLLGVTLAFLMVRQVTSQGAQQTADDEETFSRLMGSPEAEFYSAAGFNASSPRRLITPLFESLRALLSISRDEAAPFRASRFEVLV